MFSLLASIVLVSIVSAAKRVTSNLSAAGISATISKVRAVAADESLFEMSREHMRLTRFLYGKSLRDFTRHHPSLTTKYLGSYLCNSFTKKQKREILLFHHRYLTERVNEAFFKSIDGQHNILWSGPSDAGYAISLTHTAKYHPEGDLSLILLKAGQSLYELSFSIVPGTIVDSSAAATLVIARIQGAKDKFDDIREVTKSCGDISPAHLLMAACQSIATVLQIPIVIGIGNDEQIAKLHRSGVGFFFDYDVFWRTFADAQPFRGLYHISVPFAQKPLAEISVVHRRRTRTKRQFKARIAEDAEIAFRALILK